METLGLNINKDIQEYNNKLEALDKEICELLGKIISENLKDSESKVWHAHPVWFLKSNPIAGYSKQKAGIRLMFWSGKGFDEEKLRPGTGRFKDASVWYTDVRQVIKDDLHRWLRKAGLYSGITRILSKERVYLKD